jgi:hypothetical protein
VNEADELLAPDLVAQAKAMWGSEFWTRVSRYLRARREAIFSAVPGPATEREVWKREGQIEELNRMLRGDAFLAEVLRDAQTRRLGNEAPDEDVMPLWMHGEVVN